MLELPPIALTMGDAAGVGPEIILALLGSHPLAAQAHIYGSRHLLNLTLDHLARRDHRWDRIKPLLADATVVDVDHRLPDHAADAIRSLSALPFGQHFPPFGHLQGAALEAAIDDAMAGKLRALCTAPLNKALFDTAGLPPTGHTEILAERSGAPRHVMMLAGDRLRVALTTTHLPLADVARKLSVERILDTITLTHDSLRRLWRIPSPRIAVAALNPHAGEQGTMGDEELRTIAPAIALARAEGVDASGPWPADTLFAKAHPERAWPFDAVVCMYHDQALIPLKLLHFGRSANITLGLPFVRTSVDHGTAYDIAGRGEAEAGSLAYALELAASLSDANAAR